MIAIAAAEGELYARLAELDKAPSGARCLTAREGDRIVGRIWYTVGPEEAELLMIDAGEEVMREGLLRAAMNAAELNGTGKIVCRNPEMGGLLDRLGFLHDREGWHVACQEFFSRPCRGGR